MPQTNEARRLRRACGHAEEQVVAARAELLRPEDLGLQPVAQRYALRFLGERFRGQLVGRGVLPLAGAVGRLAVLMRGHHLALAALAETGQDKKLDLSPLRLCAGLPGPTPERAHDAAFDNALQAVHAKRLGPQDRQPPVTVGTRGTNQLVVGRPKALAVKVMGRADTV